MSYKKDTQYFDIIIVGTGIGGLFTAISLDKKMKVLLISKGKVSNCNTIRAEGGLAASVGKNDSPELHFEDTLKAGSGLNDINAVKVLTTEVIDRLKELESMGFTFDKDENNNYILGLEGFHSRRRILHSHGDRIGISIFNFLLDKIKTFENVKIVENTFLEKIHLNYENEFDCIDVSSNGKNLQYKSKYLILASGGYAGIYSKNTNDPYINGDLAAQCFKLGAEIEDIEFVQFHPTVLFKEGFEPFLISEAVRGEGAKLLNSKNEQFMIKYHPLKELASRDIVSRAIFEEIRIQENDSISLNLSSIDEEKILSNFPLIYENCLLRNINIIKENIPVFPAAHYSMGGIKVNLNGETSISRIYAVGEVACNGLHGANRLASNSLIESFVFGKRIADLLNNKFLDIDKNIKTIIESNSSNKSKLIFPDILEIKMKNWQYLGIERNGNDLMEYKSFLEPFFYEALADNASDDPNTVQTMNIIIVSYLIAFSALKRKESRGAHFRSDYPKEDSLFCKSIVLRRPDKNIFSIDNYFIERGQHS
jgi:L-aspartate oxidase